MSSDDIERACLCYSNALSGLACNSIHIAYRLPILGLFIFGTDSAYRQKKLHTVFDAKDDRDIKKNHVSTW